MADSLQFEIVTPVRAEFSGQVVSAVLPSEAGQMEILPGHRALLALTTHGIVVTTDPTGQTRAFVVQPGYVEVNDDQVTLLVSAAKTPQTVDAESAHATLAEAEHTLSGVEGVTSLQLKQAHEKIARAKAEIELVERFR